MPREDILEIEAPAPTIKAKNEVKPLIHEEKQTVVHCSMPCQIGMGARIWKSTYLITEGGTKIPLLFWTIIEHNGFFKFTLFFGGLPSDCKTFTLKEEIPEPGGFEVKGIRRNKTDVYRVTVI
jgi:hypothetical protein